MHIQKIALVGCGGVACQMAASLVTFADPVDILAIDGDSYEAKNQDRQPLALKYPEMNKADAFAREFGFQAMPSFLTPKNVKEIEAFGADVVISAVDNDKARDTIWTLNGRVPILWGANEVWSPQAGVSLPEKPWTPWKWLPQRPPSDNRCGIQTVFANKTAANMALALLSIHHDMPGNPDNPVFMAHEHGEPILSISLKEL